MNLSRFIALRIYRSSDAGKQVSRPAVLIATIGVAIGLAVMIIAVSVIIGFKSEVRDKIIGFGSHIQISNSDAARSFETRPIAVTDSMLAALADNSPCSHCFFNDSRPFGRSIGFLPNCPPFRFAAAIPSACRCRINSRSVWAT